MVYSTLGMAGSTKSNSLYLFIFYFLFSSLIVFTDKRGFLADPPAGRAGFRGLVQGFTTPVESQLFRARVALFAPFSVFSSTSEKDKRIQELEKENAQLLAQVTALRAVEEENARARHLLGATLPSSWHFEPARVTSVFADRMFLVSDAKPELGMPVITSEDKSGVLVGQVGEIVGKKAVVTLPTNEQLKIAVRVRDRETGERQGSGIVVGRGGKLLLEQVLTSEIVEEGDLAVTAGDENLPPELLVGYITRAWETKGAFKEAEVKMAIQPEKLDFVFLVTKF